MNAAAIGAELRRSAHLPLWLTTAAILALLVIVPGYVSPGGPNALVGANGSPAAYAFAETAEIVLQAAAALPILVLSADIADRSRGMLLTYPVRTQALALARLAAGLAWCCAWSLLALLLSGLLGFGLQVGLSLALLLPEQVFVLAGSFAVTEWSHEVGLGAGFALLALVLGFGVKGLPFAQPAALHLELSDLRNHPLTAALWLNRLSLLDLGCLLAAIGTFGMRHHRRRGSYAGS